MKSRSDTGKYGGNFPKGDGGVPRPDVNPGQDSRKGYSKHHLCALTK